MVKFSNLWFYNLQKVGFNITQALTFLKVVLECKPFGIQEKRPLVFFYIIIPGGHYCPHLDEIKYLIEDHFQQGLPGERSKELLSNSEHMKIHAVLVMQSYVVIEVRFDFQPASPLAHKEVWGGYCAPYIYSLAQLYIV